jgi:hypothetical protein
VRKILITALVGACLGVMGMFAVPGAKANSVCPAGPTVTNTGTGGTLTVGTPAGCATASGDAASQSGYAVADGAATNPGPASGYIGVDGSDGGPTIVGCASGDYDATGTTPNHVIASQAHPPTAPDPADPCTPSGP